MDLASGLTTGFAVALSPHNLLFAFLGAVIGTAVGVLPGLGPSLTISLLLPITWKLVDPTAAFILFGGLYYGVMYGGSTTSILVNTPGESGSIVTTLDGYQMARKGRAGAALATAAIGSFVAGTVATVLLMLLAPVLVEWALRFGPSEYFALMVLALTMVSAIGGDDTLRAGIAGLVGLALGMVGMDLQTGQSRFTYGVMALFDGVDLVIAAIGLFAVSEVLTAVGSLRGRPEVRERVGGPLLLSREEWRRSSWPWVRGSLLGFVVGILPGAGASIASFLSYGVERKVSARPEEFGQGAIEGVAGPEAANNASAGGAMVPLLTLGIPGSATTAVMLAAFQMYGITPGPLLLQTRPELVWGLIASLYIGNAMLLVLNLPLVGLWVRMLDIPATVLYPLILAICTLGVYSLNHNVVDLGIMFVLGLLGFVFRRAGFPLAPIVLGLVLGPLLETEFRRALTGSRGDWTVLVTRPIAAAILAVALACVLVPLLTRLRRKGGTAASPAPSAGAR